MNAQEVMSEVWVTMHRREIERVAVECLIALEAMGVQLEVISDFGLIKDKLAAMNAKLGAANSHERLLLTSGNAFWVFVSRKQMPFAAYGVRVDDLGNDDAQSFLDRSIQVIFGVNVTECHASIFSGHKWGRAAYFGGFVSSSAKGLGRTGGRIIQLMTAYGHHCAFQDLGAEVNYCFLRGSEGSRVLKYGFLEADPFVWSTDRPMYPDGNPEWIMRLPKDRMPALMASMSGLISHRLAKN